MNRNCLLGFAAGCMVWLAGCTSQPAAPVSHGMNRFIGLKVLVLRNPSHPGSAVGSALTGVSWELSNGRTIRPDSADITFETITAAVAVVGLAIPATAPPIVEYAILDKTGNTWIRSGTVDIVWRAPFQNRSRGLDLPFSRWVAASLSLNARCPSSWWFFQEGRTAVVVVRAPLAVLSFQGFHEHLHPFFFYSRQRRDNVVGVEEGLVAVAVAGPYATGHLWQMLNSLPLASSATFPYQRY
jgi:hypothetical protein